MKIQYKVSLLLLIFMFSSTVIAKNDQLVQDMIDLEQAYIPVLFFTGKPVIPNEPPNEEQLLNISKGMLKTYMASWEVFSEEYKTYRSSWRNWISYFDKIEGLISDADTLLNDGSRLAAHDVLEEIRTTMAEFRGRNGFPKFIVDQFTDFHTIMGEIISIASNDFDENTLEILFELFNEASHAWSKVERNDVDPDAWNLSSAEEVFYYNMIEAERAALDDFESALYSYSGEDDEGLIKATAKALKPSQAQAYLTLGGVINKE